MLAELELEKKACAVLGVALEAGPAEIKAAYRRLVKLYHPDNDPANPALVEKFKLISEAYEILVHKKNRGHYALMQVQVEPGEDEEPVDYLDWWRDHFGRLP